LKGWFRFQALSQLYQLQQRQDASLNLGITEQQTAQSAFLRLLLVGSTPVFGSLMGIGIFIAWGLRTYFTRPTDRSDALSEGASATPIEAFSVNGSDAFMPPATDTLPSSVVWPTETIWQVMVLWFTAFFGINFLLIPLLVAGLGVNPEAFSGRMQTYFALLSYGGLMVIGWGILHWSLRPYIPNVLRWLKLRWTAHWIGWGLGGYFVALPLVLIISWLNQQLLQDQGGGNPILDIILHSHDGVTIGLLWFLVAVCAPVFEETLFRGFFLTSLTRYMPTWQAIGLSALLFAMAHLNLGDLLPLTLLGMVLGFVYWRSRNLLSSMLLHSLWNSGSFIALLLLGSSAS
ncbi:MAG: type II CAAX endopeptidase family protein, partial [Thermosynechococcaceae cyanobacterium]